VAEIADHAGSLTSITTRPEGAFAYPDGFFLVTLEPASDRWPSTSSQVAMFVPDVDAAYERAVAAGAESLEAPFDSDAFPRSAIIADPGGNYIQIYESG
jgi:predicted enzyme related to lactoylglutathione lyase